MHSWSVCWFLLIFLNNEDSSYIGAVNLGLPLAGLCFLLLHSPLLQIQPPTLFPNFVLGFSIMSLACSSTHIVAVGYASGGLEGLLGDKARLSICDPLRTRSRGTLWWTSLTGTGLFNSRQWVLPLWSKSVWFGMPTRQQNSPWHDGICHGHWPIVVIEQFVLG